MKNKIGIGYDIHRLEQGRKLILGGVDIPYEKGLLGHSDADVLLHAVCDAILGALGKGDIGEHFPDTDPKYKDISSMVLLERVKDVLIKENCSIENIDVIVQAEEPKLKDYKKQMSLNVAGCLGIEESSVNIKATTMEKVGPIGNKEAIAAYAAVLITKK